MIQALTCILFLVSNFTNTKTSNSFQQKNAPLTPKIDTLNILISKANNIFYYNGELQPDASNFKIGTVRSVKDWVKYSSEESSRQQHQLLIILKIQDLANLNESSKQFVDFIHKQQNYKLTKLSEVEKELIRITEDAMK